MGLFDFLYVDKFKHELDVAKKQIADLNSHCIKLEKEKNAYIAKLVEEKDAYAANLSQMLHIRTKEYNEIKQELDKHNDSLRDFLSSNVKKFPFLAGVTADYLTYDLELLAKKLDWGKSVERAKKVASIREIRAEAKRRIEESRLAVYQLEYLKAMFPAIEDILETDYTELQFSEINLSDYDPVRNYLSREEWITMSETQKNQIALDRYIESRRKTNWQIGRDYELYVGYTYQKKGYTVDFYGSYNGIEDLGRDLIATKDKKTLIIQCKYWSQKKQIHEKHIAQLYGTAVCYALEQNISFENITPILITNITLSDTAKRFADYLAITVIESFELKEFPRIKCNIGKDEFGFPTKIYHLPMDQQYDKVKIDKKGEFFAFTVKEAEGNGFRRAYKWHSHTN